MKKVLGRLWKVFKVSGFITGMFSNLIVFLLVTVGTLGVVTWHKAPKITIPEDLVMVETADKTTYYSESNWVPEEYKDCLIFAVPGLETAKVFCEISSEGIKYVNHRFAQPVMM